MEIFSLAHLWAGIIAVAILVYVLLDGFDLGVGILFGMTRDGAKRGPMMAAIALMAAKTTMTMSIVRMD